MLLMMELDSVVLDVMRMKIGKEEKNEMSVVQKMRGINKER